MIGDDGVVLTRQHRLRALVGEHGREYEDLALLLGEHHKLLIYALLYAILLIKKPFYIYTK